MLSIRTCTDRIEVPRDSSRACQLQLPARRCQAVHTCRISNYVLDYSLAYF